jgi:hypothetical protein
MPTSLEEPRTPGAPVVKRTALGQVFTGALVNVEQRNVLKRNDVTSLMEPVLKPDGKAKQELVLTLVTMPGTTAPAGIGDHNSVPEPGEVVRLILRGRAFGDWIEAKRDHGVLETGDVVTQTTEYGQAYSGTGTLTGPKLTTQAELDAVPRTQSLGIYGSLSLRKPTPAEAEWAAKADAAHHDQRPRTPIAAGNGFDDDEEPF